MFCLFVRVRSLLKVTCGVENCSCNGRACIKYEIPGTNYQIQKCMEPNSCTGIYPGDFNVFRCSGIPANIYLCILLMINTFVRRIIG